MNISTAKLISLLTLSLVYSSCSDTEVDKGINSVEPTTRKFTFSIQESSNAILSPINGYLFRKGTFYKAFRNLSSDGERKIILNIPAYSELFFMANIDEPDELKAMKEGNTTLDEFLSFHTPDNEVHSATQAPSQFYSAHVLPDLSNQEFNITMGLSVARIDLDVSEAANIKIERIYTEEAASTTTFFEGENISTFGKSCSYSHEFDTPETGKVEDIFRIYEKKSPIVFIMEGSQGNIPISISTTIKRIERNKIYRIRIQSAGMNITSSINIADWITGDEITVDNDKNTNVSIDTDESYLPDGAEFKSNSVINLPFNGAKNLKLAFISSDPLSIDSIEGRINSVSSPEISNKAGRILTKYEFNIPENNTKLVSCVTLNLQIGSKLKTTTSKVTLNIKSFPYTIPEVTIGNMTWMAFNVTTSKLSEQIYPEVSGYGDVKSMYDNKWINTLGNMFQYGRRVSYTPWYSDKTEQQDELPWSDSDNTPCPDGYRLPTQKELSDLISGDGQASGGGGYIPSEWHCRGDIITGKIVEKSKVEIHEISGTARYLELKNQKGVAIYFPLGGMKEKANPPTKDPKLGNGFRYWVAESAGSGKAHACELIFMNDFPRTVPDTEAKVDKEAFSYVRCVKKY